MSEKVTTPKFFEQLSADDQTTYKELQEKFSSKQCRNNRNHRVSVFSEILNMVKDFCERGDANDSIRCLVCGYCTMPGGFAVNIRQMRILVDKCKSSINGSLQRMGAAITPMRNELAEMLQQKIPQLKSTFTEMREWSVRQLSATTPQPTLPKWDMPTIPTAARCQVMPTPPPAMPTEFDPYLPDTYQTEISEEGDPFCLTPDFLGGFDW